jgi:hypothetical protein
MRQFLILAIFIAFLTATGFAQPPQWPDGYPSVDQYGGLTALPANDGQSGWRLHKYGNRWLFVDPDGNGVFVFGVWALTCCSGWEMAKYGNDATWATQTDKRLQRWGFNSLWDHTYGNVLPWGTSTVKMNASYLMDGANYPARNVWSYCSQGAKLVSEGINPTYYWGYLSASTDPYDPCFTTWNNAAFAPATRISEIDTVMASNYTIGWSSGESDYMWGFGAGPDFTTVPPGHDVVHLIWLVLAASPTQSIGYVNYGATLMVYPDNVFYAKATFKTFLQGRYANIAGLNTAWASSYTTWDTSGAKYTSESLCAGQWNGSKTSCTQTLAHSNVISGLSVAVKINSTVVGGDNRTGGLRGTNISTSSTINYSNGNVVLTFTTAPPNGSDVNVDYCVNCWGPGTGFDDEDGRHSWMGDFVNLAGETTTMKTDLNDFMLQYASKFFSVQRTALKTYFPTKLYLGPNMIGSWGTPPRREILQAAGAYIDALQTQIGTGVSDDQDRLDFIGQYYGDHPITIWMGFPANPDSACCGTGGWCTNPDTFLASNTQVQRGVNYNSSYSWLANTAVGSGVPGGAANSYLVNGIKWWAWTDSTSEQANWGLVSYTKGNPYDGVESVTGSVTDPWGYQSGYEDANYGNFMGPGTNTAIGTNVAIMQMLAGGGPPAIPTMPSKRVP